MRYSWLILIFSSFLVYASHAQVKQFVSPQTIGIIKLKTTDNKPSFIAQGKPTVLVFLSPECPLSKNYAPILNALQKKYSQVNFYGICPGNGYSGLEINDYKKKYDIGFKILIDPIKQLTSYLKATTTPEVILMDSKCIILYQGQIDNWAVSLGKTRQVITKHYLDDAISQFIGGKQITVKHTNPVGCLINDI